MIFRASLSLFLLITLGCDRRTVRRAAKELGAVTTTLEPSREGLFQTGRVVGVADGDTITVLDAGEMQHKIRLMGIDAPEKAMPFGQRSKQNLSNLVFGKEVQLDIRSIDRYKREVAKVMVEGRDINLAQVEAGMAWVYRHYLKELTQEEASAYINAEDAAKAAGRGLWADPDPTPPWDWRKSKKRKPS